MFVKYQAVICLIHFFSILTKFWTGAWPFPDSTPLEAENDIVSLKSNDEYRQYAWGCNENTGYA